MSIHIRVTPDAELADVPKFADSGESREATLLLKEGENVVEFGVRVAHEIHLLATQ